MSGAPADQDNSIEEILASIRQIISEDEPKPAEAEVSAPAAVAPEPAPQTPEPTPADDVFELVDRVVAEEEEPVVDAPEPTPEPIPAPEPEAVDIIDMVDTPPEPEPVAPAVYVESAPAAPSNPIFGDVAAAATASAFAKLSDTILVERQRAIAGANVTLEDIVKELLSPILRQWVDAHVPAIVERLVRDELEKLARQAREG